MLLWCASKINSDVTSRAHFCFPQEMYFETPPSGTPCSASSPERGSPRKPSTSSTPGGTPGSMSSPERASYRKFCSPDRSSARQSLDKLLDKSLDSPVCKISDVLDCDRGEIYPGISTDGDIATIQTFDVGKCGVVSKSTLKYAVQYSVS